MPGGHAEAEAKGAKCPPLVVTNPSKHEPLFHPSPNASALHLNPTRQTWHLAAGPIWSKPETRRRSHGTPGSPGFQTPCDSLQKAETFIDHHAIGSRAKQAPLPPAVPTTTLTGEIPSPFQNRHALFYTLSAVSEGPRAAAFSCSPPAPRLQRQRAAQGRWASPSSPPLISSATTTRQPNPTFPIQQKPWRCHQEELLFGGRPYRKFSIYAGPDR